jgi:hypothetical protein
MWAVEFQCCRTVRASDSALTHHGVQLCSMSGRRSDQETGLETGVHACHKRRPETGEGVPGLGPRCSIAGYKPSGAGLGARGEDGGLCEHYGMQPEALLLVTRQQPSSLRRCPYPYRVVCVSSRSG